MAGGYSFDIAAAALKYQTIFQKHFWMSSLIFDTILWQRPLCDTLQFVLALKQSDKSLNVNSSWQKACLKSRDFNMSS